MAPFAVKLALTPAQTFNTGLSRDTTGTGNTVIPTVCVTMMPPADVPDTV